jgi:phosphoglycerate dehydrogenase-like enzyme
MRVLAHDRSPERPEKQRAARALGVRFVGLEELFSEAEMIAVQVPLNDQTRSLVGAALLDRMPPGAFLVNVARGQIVDEQALYDALKHERLGGAALDVFAAEPPGEHPLLKLENFLATPHVGAQTVEAQRHIGEAVVRAIDEFNFAGNAS